MDEVKKFKAMNKYEDKAYRCGQEIILGIDEVGRGCIAGEVVVGGVILDKNIPVYGLDDSKKLSKKKREELNELIIKDCLCYKTVGLSASDIDKFGIANCIRKAVHIIIEELNKEYKIDKVLIDYMKIDIDIDHEILKKGDQVSNSIAASSIVAKVYRDNLMKEISKKYPAYKFEKNVGYGTREHIEAIKEYGIIKGIHRESFEPIKSLVKE